MYDKRDTFIFCWDSSFLIRFIPYFSSVIHAICTQYLHCKLYEMPAIAMTYTKSLVPGNQRRIGSWLCYLWPLFKYVGGKAGNASKTNSYLWSFRYKLFHSHCEQMWTNLVEMKIYVKRFCKETQNMPHLASKIRYSSFNTFPENWLRISEFLETIVNGHS